MVDYVPSEKGITIRYPSTANLYIDSQDRVPGTKSNNFTITKKNNILTGFFTRLAVQEVVVDYCVNNVNSDFNNNFLTAYLYPASGTITAYSTSGTVATFTCASTNTVVGQVVIISGIASPATLNGTYIIATRSSTQFTVANTTPAGSGSISGTAVYISASQPIITATGNGTTLSITIDSIPSSFIVGAIVDIYNCSNTAFNGTRTITAIVGNTLQFNSSVVGNSTGGQVVSIGQSGTATLPNNQYTVAECLTKLVSQLNLAVVGTNGGASLSGFTLVNSTDVSGQAFLTNTANFIIIYDQLAINLDLQDGFSPGSRSKLSECPKLLPTLYFDITSDTLTYCQDLKDASTASINRDVLFRWYLAWDGPTTYDTIGYPIFQGYKPFLQRRSIPFPKQIKWDNIQPIGQLSFQLYDDRGNLFETGESVSLTPSLTGGTTNNAELEFNINLLVSEV